MRAGEIIGNAMILEWVGSSVVQVRLALAGGAHPRRRQLQPRPRQRRQLLVPSEVKRPLQTSLAVQDFRPSLMAFAASVGLCVRPQIKINMPLMETNVSVPIRPLHALDQRLQ